MHLVGGLLALASTSTAFVPCDIDACTCAGVQLGGGFRGAAPLKLTDGTHSYLLSICAPLGPTVEANCSFGGADLAAKASFARIDGICEELGDTATMAAEIVEDGGPNGERVLVVRYNYTFGSVTQVTIAFAKGTDTAPKATAGASVTNPSAGSYAVFWDGLAEDPPVPTLPAPVNPEPEPVGAHYHCLGPFCKAGTSPWGTNYGTDTCNGECKTYTCQCVSPGHASCMLRCCWPAD